MIPKIIHYCWLSGESYPELIEKCISSWEKNLSDYKIMLWDTDRIDINSNLWLKQAYESKKYAFAADYIRFYALYNFGGIYLDADVELLKSFDPLLNNEQFIGEEYGGDFEAAVMGAEKGREWVKDCLKYYENRAFIKSDGTFDLRPVPLLINEMMAGRNIEVKPYFYFSPKNFHTGKIYITDSSYCIHHFDGKWVRKSAIVLLKLSFHKVLYHLLGRKNHNRIISIIRKSIYRK